MTDKELRTLDEMLTNLEIWSTWNKTFANEMIGICSKMRNLLADRKDEPQKWTKENCKGCKYNEYPYDSGTCFVRVCINGNKYEPKDKQSGKE